MKKPVQNLPASVKARLATLASSTGRPFNEVLQYYAIERFLFRLACSPYSQHFILKGGLLFYARQIPLRRPTRDIDLQASTTNSIPDLEQSVRAICAQPVEPDGMKFDPASIAGERIMNTADFQGIRVKGLAYLGTARTIIQLDVSYANVITPDEVSLAYPTLLDTPEPSLRAYPYETVIAEKLQALVFLGSLNDRLKDFYDLWLLSQQITFQGQTLRDAIRATFTHRNTPIPADPPIALTQDFAAAKQQQWLTLLRKSSLTGEALADFAGIIARLREFLMPPMAAAAQNASFAATWVAAEAWTP